jgi:hypothetical protein
MDWRPEYVEFVRKHFADSRTADIATALGCTYSAVAQKAAAMGLKKSEAYLASEAACRLGRGQGGATRFQKGQPAWNKGVKGVVGVQEACRATQFKKGRPAHEARNYLPIGSLRVCKDGYLERKISDDPSIAPARRWVAVHRLVWAEAHGEIPQGHLVRFKRGMSTTDPEQITVDRLECVSRAEHMRTHTYHQYGPEVAQVVQLRGAISRQINKRAKEGATS